MDEFQKGKLVSERIQSEKNKYCMTLYILHLWGKKAKLRKCKKMNFGKD